MKEGDVFSPLLERKMHYLLFTAFMHLTAELGLGPETASLAQLTTR